MGIDEGLKEERASTNWLFEDRPNYIFGPCSAESPEQLRITAKQIVNNFPNAIFRAGVWKPRTLPNSFEGVGEEGLNWLSAIGREFGLRTTTEVAHPKHVEASLKAGIDMLWIGARTTASPFSVQALADALAGVDIPVFIKNPLHPDLALWIGALERFRSSGHKKIGAIHRGFYLADNKNYRNYPHWDLAVQLKAKYPEIPLISDISHMAGKPSLLPQLAQKAMNLDMDGLLIETHYDPTIALSDAEQQIKPDQLKSLIDGITFKSVSSEDQEFRNKLDLLRAQIDKIDEELVDKVVERMGIAEEIGIYKKQNQVTILQLERWQQIMRQVKAQAELLGLSDGFIEKLYNAIHEESIRIQTDSKEE